MKERRELKDLRKPVIYDEAGRKAKKKLTINYTGLVQSITFNWKFLSGDTAFLKIYLLQISKQAERFFKTLPLNLLCGCFLNHQKE